MSKGMGTPTQNLTSTVKAFLKEQLGVTDVTTTEQAIKNTKIMKYLDDKVQENNELAISRAQYVRKFRVLPYDFSMEGEELTPTLKLKRRVVLEKYKDIIAEMYPEDETRAKI
jgi:long-chain-fatty-acid--CoA ligase ACSBG